MAMSLAAAAAVGVDHEPRRGPVTLRQIAVEQVDPALLAGGAAGAGVLEGVADRETGEHLLLNAKEDPTEIDSCVVAVAADHSIPALRIAHGSGRFGVLTPRDADSKRGNFRRNDRRRERPCTPRPCRRDPPRR